MTNCYIPILIHPCTSSVPIDYKSILSFFECSMTMQCVPNNIPGVLTSDFAQITTWVEKMLPSFFRLLIKHFLDEQMLGYIHQKKFHISTFKWICPTSKFKGKIISTFLKILLEKYLRDV